MRLQLASDLHLDMLDSCFPAERLIAPAADADLLVLAGDVAHGVQSIELFANWPVPVLYVPGNHEFYGLSWEQTRADLRRAAQGTSVVLLDNDAADFSRFGHWFSSRREELASIRFLGATLWTDYKFRSGSTQRQNMAAAERKINDHFRIRTQEGIFRAEQALQDHELSKAWLERELAKPFEGTTVVITHHGPHPLSVHPRWLAPDTLETNAAFVSDLTPLLNKADLWLHGHVHDTFDYRVGRARVMTNPLGYARNRSQVDTPAQLVFENPLFNWACLVEVPAPSPGPLP